MFSVPCGRRLGLLLIFLLATLPLAAQTLRAAPTEEPEEPDYFFLTGGPYTQKKNSPQIIWANQWYLSSRGGVRTRAYTGAGRFELGLTDRWEVDFEFGALHARERLLGVTTFSQGGTADLLFGVRYRLLDESFAPFTLTMGPQVVAPVASRRRGLGTGKVGYAWDLAAAKEWAGPVFVAASVNLGVTPGVPAFADGTGPEFDLSQVAGAVALGFRPLERATALGASHDIHILLEVGGSRADEIEAGQRVRATEVFFAPGLRYGFLGRGGSLTEIGVSFPLGLTGSSADWGFILQFQYELPSLFAEGGKTP
ncbi:MAG: hypothetical protein IH847_08845 [Acidobacteria bacterium]|nr:hypothetical protein [Acidobacteriota bacterium]